MYDFFVDHFVSFEKSLTSIINKLKRLARQGGGSIITRQHVLRGGKAVNTCSALASLGAKAHLIGRTSSFGLYLLRFFLERKGVDISHVKADGRIGLTVALEMHYKGRLFNVMCNDLGSNADFNFTDLDSSDLDLIRKTDCLFVTDWSLNLKGNDLTEGVFDFARREGVPLILFDPGDLSWRKQDIPSLMERVILKRNYDVLSVNEGEAIWLAMYLANEAGNKARTVAPEIAGIECCRILSDYLNRRVDLHTSLFSATFENGKEYMVPTYQVPVLRVTGAGDCWNAGNIYGQLIGLSPIDRLLLANAVAAYYISHPEGNHATKEDINKFVESHNVRKLEKLR